MRRMRTTDGSVGTAAGGVTVTLAELLAVTGSNWSLALMVAVFVIALGPTTVATIDSVSGAAVVMVPTVHTPVAEL